MINSLFSSFDPIRGYGTFNYTVLSLPIIIPLFSKIFIKERHTRNLYHLVLKFLNSELKIIIPNQNIKDKRIILIRIFFSILILNLIGLLPYVYSITSQLIYTLILALPFWLRFIIFSLKNSFSNFFSHLVPTGTPMALSHFIVLIESIRQAIRPITLSVRLAANITAGHILIILIRNTILILNPISIVLIALFLLELAVAFIQRYVFTLLLSIYLSETT